MDHRELNEWHHRAALQRQDKVSGFTVNLNDLKVIQALKGDKMSMELLDFLAKQHGAKARIDAIRAIWQVSGKKI